MQRNMVRLAVGAERIESEVIILDELHRRKRYDDDCVRFAIILDSADEPVARATKVPKMGEKNSK